MLLAHKSFGEGDVLSTDEAAAGGFVDGPRQVGGGKDEDTCSVAFGRFGFATGRCFLEVGPLDEEFGLDAAGGFVL